MTEEVRNLIKEEKLIEAGDTVLVGVSGGADSVCLLFILNEYRKEIDFSLKAVHVEHGIRGKESLEDAKFVENLCKRLGVCCKSYHVDVPSYANENHVGLEEAARELRYHCFEQAAQVAIGRVKIALAHHADDNAETIIFQMVRGSGVRGLSGMPIKRVADDGVIYIRPLIGMTRGQIEKYLQQREEVYCVDCTNADVNYSRNRIRHEVMPALKQINAQAVAHITQSARQLGELADYIEIEAKRVAQDVCERQEQGYLIKKELFDEYPNVLQKKVLYQTISTLAGSRKDIANVHVDSVHHLMNLQAGRQLDLPYSLLAERVYDGIRICKKSEASIAGKESYRIPLQEIETCGENGWYVLQTNDGILRMRVYDFEGEIDEIPKKAYTKLLNYGKIKSDLLFRKRAGGDYLIIDEMGHKKKIKEYFIEEKVPREQRDDIWLLTEESHVLWVVGKRIGADVKIDRNTKKILEIQMSGGKYYED